MIAQIRDRDAPLHLATSSLRAYLDAREWRNEGPWGEPAATIFAKEHDGQTWKIIVPHLDTVAGHVEGMAAAAVAVLAAVEGRSQPEVYDDLAGFGGKAATAPDADGSKYRCELGGIYGVAEAARYVKAAPDAETLYPATSRALRGWIRQRCGAAGQDEFPVAFADLIAMRVIAALRSAGVSQREVSDSESLMQEWTGVKHPLAAETFWAGEGQAFSKWRQWLIDADSRGPAALDLVREYLTPARDLVFDEPSGQTISWEPQPGIVLDPLVQFGAPCIKGTGIPTGAVSGMIAAGDAKEWTARAYRISPEDVQAACDWESRLKSA